MRAIFNKKVLKPAGLFLNILGMKNMYFFTV